MSGTSWDADDLQRYVHNCRFVAQGLGVLHQELKNEGFPARVIEEVLVAQFMLMMRPDHSALLLGIAQQIMRDDDE